MKLYMVLISTLCTTQIFAWYFRGTPDQKPLENNLGSKFVQNLKKDKNLRNSFLPQTFCNLFEEFKGANLLVVADQWSSGESYASLLRVLFPDSFYLDNFLEEAKLKNECGNLCLSLDESELYLTQKRFNISGFILIFSNNFNLKDLASVAKKWCVLNCSQVNSKDNVDRELKHFSSRNRLCLKNLSTTPFSLLRCLSRCTRNLEKTQVFSNCSCCLSGSFRTSKLLLKLYKYLQGNQIKIDVMCKLLTDSKICMNLGLSNKYFIYLYKDLLRKIQNDSKFIEQTFEKVQNFRNFYNNSLNTSSKNFKIFLLENFKPILSKSNYAVRLSNVKYMCRNCILIFTKSPRIIFDTSPYCFGFCKRLLNWSNPFRIEKFQEIDLNKNISVLFQIANFGNSNYFFRKTSKKNKLSGNSFEKSGKFNTTQMAAFKFENFINLRRKKRKVSYSSSSSSSSSLWRKNVSSRFLNIFTWEGEDKTLLLPTNYPSVSKFYNMQENTTRNSLNSEVYLTMPPNGTLLMDDSENSDSVLFFSLSLTIFAFVGIVIFVRRCVRCPQREGNDPSPMIHQYKPPSPIQTLYSGTPENQVQFSPINFKEIGSTPNLPTTADIASLVSRDCMTSPEFNSPSVYTPDSPRDFNDIMQSNSNFFSFPPYARDVSPSRPTLYSYGTSYCTSIESQSPFMCNYERGMCVENACRDAMQLHQIHLNLMASSPSLMLRASQSSLGLSLSRSNVSYCSEYTNDQSYEDT
ncbi:UNVERIFIED_CONTAM: hypothetical protein RMT77_006818 [Armadillidium vulgare]